MDADVQKVDSIEKNGAWLDTWHSVRNWMKGIHRLTWEQYETMKNISGSLSGVSLTLTYRSCSLIRSLSHQTGHIRYKKEIEEIFFENFLQAKILWLTIWAILWQIGFFSKAFSIPAENKKDNKMGFETTNTTQVSRIINNHDNDTNTTFIITWI